MAKKKAIVLIVEGPTDQVVMEPLNNLIDNHRFKIKVIGGDSYSSVINRNTPSRNIVGDIMKSVMQETKFKPQDIHLVLQLVDTDGAFLTEDTFVTDNTSTPFNGKSYCYDLEKREVLLNSDEAKSALIGHWQQKGQHLKALCKGVQYSKLNIPYFLFFNSLNLEHVTGNHILEDSEKDIAALEFIEEIGCDTVKLIEFFQSKCPYTSYEQSWQEIMIDENWHESKSNVPFLIEKIIETEQLENQS